MKCIRPLVSWDILEFQVLRIPSFSSQCKESSPFPRSKCSFSGAAILPGVLKKGGVYFATAGEKGIVRVWSSRSSTPVAEQLLEGPFEEGSQLTGLALSTSGHLISTSEDAKIQFLDPQVSLSNIFPNSSNHLSPAL